MLCNIKIKIIPIFKLNKIMKLNKYKNKMMNKKRNLTNK